MSAEDIHAQVISDRQLAAASTASIGETLYDFILDKGSANSNSGFSHWQFNPIESSDQILFVSML